MSGGSWNPAQWESGWHKGAITGAIAGATVGTAFSATFAVSGIGSSPSGASLFDL